MELKLSSAYEHLAGEPDLELKVLMLNVNEGHNKDLMEQCQTLKEYAIYVARVRKYASAQNLNDAVERAITECIKEGILVDFLRKNRSEVKMVSILEYDKEWEEKKLRKAEYEAGKSDGIEIGKSEGIKIGRHLLDTFLFFFLWTHKQKPHYTDNYKPKNKHCYHFTHDYNFLLTFLTQ